MLKANLKHKLKKHKKAPKQKATQKIKKPRVILPNNTSVQNTDVPRAISYGGIPYQSSQSLFSLTNKTPYLLESLIAKPPSQTIQPNLSPTTSVTQGANIMTQTNSMADQTKTQSIQFVDLVSPSKNGNNETQPEYINLAPPPKKQPMPQPKYINLAPPPKKQPMPEPKPLKKRLRGPIHKKNEEL